MIEVNWEIEVRRVELTPGGKRGKTLRRTETLTDRQLMQSTAPARLLVGNIAEAAFLAVKNMVPK